MMTWKKICCVEESTVGDDLDAIVLNIVDDNLVEEGAAKAIAFGLLSFILSSSGIVNAAQFRRGALKFMQDKQVERGGKVTVTKGELKGLVEQAKVPTKMVGKWELQKARNIIASSADMVMKTPAEKSMRSATATTTAKITIGPAERQ